VNHLWSASQLRVFVLKIDQLDELDGGDLIERIAARDSGGASPANIVDELITLDPVMRDIMNAAHAGYGDYSNADAALTSPDSPSYWSGVVKPWALRAIGIHTLGVEAAEQLRPDSPDLAADQLHPWVWDAAAPLWYAGSRQEAVHAAARSVNARLVQKRGHHDKSEAALCREFFSSDPPAPGRPRLRFPDYASDLTRLSRQRGAMDFGAGCFEGIRNPAAHEHDLDLPEQVALEQLAAFSLLARWIEECTVEHHAVDRPEPASTLL
jgi:Protein of unknown function (Hypoth_ymh)